MIVTLYYSLYHLFLALVESNGFSSKNHNATIVFVIRHYIQIKEEEIKLLDSLRVSEEDAKFYTPLKEKRTQASYSTNLVLK